MTHYCAEYERSQGTMEPPCNKQCNNCKLKDTTKTKTNKPPMDSMGSIEALRETFFNETGIAPIFAQRSPYIDYIKFLEYQITGVKQDD